MKKSPSQSHPAIDSVNNIVNNYKDYLPGMFTEMWQSLPTRSFATAKILSSNDQMICTFSPKDNNLYVGNI